MIKKTITCDECGKEVGFLIWSIHVNRISSQPLGSLEYVNPSDFCNVKCLIKYFSKHEIKK